MKTLDFNEMEVVQGGTDVPLCAAGIAMVIVSSGVNIFAFTAGVLVIASYC